MVYFNFLNFLAIFYYISLPRRVGTERNDNFYFLSFLPFLTNFGLKEAIIVFFNFFNFVGIFLELSITGQVGSGRNDNFYFLSFSAFSNLVWLGMKT